MHLCVGVCGGSWERAERKRPGLPLRPHALLLSLRWPRSEQEAFLWMTGGIPRDPSSPPSSSDEEADADWEAELQEESSGSLMSPPSATERALESDRLRR